MVPAVKAPTESATISSVHLLRGRFELDLGASQTAAHMM